MKIIRRAAAFLLIFLLILSGLSLLTAQGVKKYAYSIKGRNRPVAVLSAEPKDSLEVLVTGDSESYTSVIPMELWNSYGMTAYVCGQSGQRIQETYYMLKHGFANQSPKLVILETNALFRDPGNMKNAHITIGEMLRHYLPVIRYHNLWKNLFDDPGAKLEDYMGFSIRSGRKAYKGDEYMKETKERQEMSPFVQHYIEKIREMCEEEGTELLLVSVPSPRNYNYKKHNAVQEYADAHGIAYLDLNLELEKLGIDWEQDSYDGGDHLNLSGARKVTKHLGEYLNSHYSLKDCRGDSAYGRWADMYEEYEKAVRAVQR